jgi:glycosyltransferase involved in cell wall biosynthesis
MIKMRIINIIIVTEDARGCTAGLQYGKYLSKYVDTTIAMMESKYDDVLFSDVGIDDKKVLKLPQKKGMKQIIEKIPFFPKRYSNVFIKTNLDLSELKKYDIVHLHHTIPFFSFKQIADMCVKNNIPYVNILHDLNVMINMPEALDMKKYQKIIYNKLILKNYITILNNASCLFALTEADKALAKSLFPNKKIVVSPNGVVLSEFNININDNKYQSFLEENDVDPNKKLILFVGSIDKRKGVDILVKAVKNVNEEFQLLIVGPKIDSRFYSYIEKLIGDDSKIKVLDYVSKKNLIVLYNLADIFVLPSLSEGLPLVLLEAMAARTPCIASDIMGSNEVVEHNKTGFLFPKGDVNSLTGYLAELLGDKDLRKYMGDNAQKVVKEKYDWDVIVKNNIEIYKEILRGGYREGIK